MANVFFVLTCLGLLVNIASSDDMDCTRPPPPQWREEMKCCKMPGMKHRDFSTGRDCMKEIEDAHPEFEFKRHHHPKPFGNNNITQCFEQCVYKKSSLLDGDNKLNSTAIREDVTKQLTGVWKEVGVKLVDECLETAQKKVAENAECKSGSFEFKMCFLRGLFMNCPAESWTDSMLNLSINNGKPRSSNTLAIELR
uniref:OBP25 n=1 Tax=Corythucha ciliata TaxID=369451 RepID=A0A3G2YUY0_CORCT|nr:OBP25 [Corythucha ciliata]